MPRPTSFGKDTGLQVRMAVTLFLLGLVYVVFVVALLAANVHGITVAIIAGGLALVQIFASDKLALAAMGARVVTPQEAPQLHAMIERLCVQADLPKPRVAVANTRMPNAFAMGRSPKSATVCATTGMRVEPPTSSTASMSAGVSPADRTVRDRASTVASSGERSI